MTDLLQTAAVTDWTIPLVVVLAIAGVFVLRWQIRTYHRPATHSRPRPPKAAPVDFAAELRRVGPMVPWSETRLTTEAEAAAMPRPASTTTHGDRAHDSHHQ